MTAVECANGDQETKNKENGKPLNCAPTLTPVELPPTSSPQETPSNSDFSTPMKSAFFPQARSLLDIAFIEKSDLERLCGAYWGYVCEIQQEEQAQTGRKQT